MSYDIASRDYLRRAEKLLEDGSQESLFYTAFELRCGIVARMQQYLEAQEEVSEKKKTGWKIQALGKDIEEIFQKGDKIGQFEWFEKGGTTPILILYYTPVNSKLRKMAERLGGYMHAMEKFRDSDDPWWLDMRNLLSDVCSELRKANIGTLVGLPLLNPKTRESTMITEVPEGEDPYEYARIYGEIGTDRILKVNYLEELPPSALGNT